MVPQVPDVALPRGLALLLLGAHVLHRRIERLEPRAQLRQVQLKDLQRNKKEGNEGYEPKILMHNCKTQNARNTEGSARVPGLAP